MDSQQIRATFLRFFEEREHRVMPSAPLVPVGDPTLLFTSAGMVQFKPYFEGRAAPPARRLASVQKCFRTSDIDSVGDTAHLTFFEMLGNFSIGDYFKEKAIPWAWELVTDKNWFAIPKERLWAAVYLDDDEAFDLWLKVGVPAERIMRYGEEHNYWFSGDVGPCGPCSELHYDLGPTPGCPECQRDRCHPAIECGRFLEIWNLVFMTYFQHPDGSRTPLPAKNIDTGMGLERTAVILQDKRTLYETDLFAPIIRRVKELSGRRYGRNKATDRAMRIVAEHVRAAVFLVGDDKTPVLPSNEERGYAVRRIIRRAIYYGRHHLGLSEPFVADVAGRVIDHMGDTYPQLRQQQEFALRVLEGEEERFEQTLSRGTDLVSAELLPAHEGAVRIISDWAQAIHAVMTQRPADEWEPYMSEPSHEARRALVNMTLLIGAMTPEGIPWERVPHWLIGETLSPLTEAFDEATATISQELGRTHDEVFRQIGARKLPRQEVLSLAKDKLAEKADLIRESVAQVEEAARDLQKGLSGREVFVLADTYGFPMELTREITRERGFTIDEEGFQKLMEEQRERARAATKLGAAKLTDEGTLRATATVEGGETPFLGYETLSAETTVVALLKDSGQTQSASESEAVEVILRETPFYGEAGGQVGDTGEIVGPHGRIQVEDTQWAAERLIFHRGRVIDGTIALNDAVVARVDEPRRRDIMRNHTATHLLHAALRRVLGSHVRQAGSLVAPDRLRFDFTHMEALKPEELAEIQRIVNEKIRADLPVTTRLSSFDEAMKEGVLAFFDEKYGDQVRVVETKEDGERFSGELCGGTHCSATGQIGLFLIVGESSIGAGMRRIEAVTGRGAEAYVQEQLAALESASRRLGAAPADLESKAASLLSELEGERKRVQALERALAAPAAEAIVGKTETVDGIPLLAARVDAPSQDALRHMGDVLRQRLGSAVVVLGTVLNGRPAFMAMVTPDLVKRGLHAGHVLERVASAAGGGGGGRPEMAQGGGTDASKLDEALGLVKPLVKELLAKKS
jgi:alanyl-tRNA synthetase